MPYRKEQFANKEIYHIVLRALDNNLIFKDIDDYYRGIFSIYEFNNDIPVEILERRKQRKKEKTAGDRVSPETRKLLVEILAFCFMPNHIHLLLKQITNNGLSKFMKKFGIGYASYFNRKYKRKGYVFQNRFLSVHIKNDNQLKIVFNYIHTNPLSLIEPGWKEIGIKDPKKSTEFLESYKWSSYQDYIGIKNFPSVSERNFMLEIMGREEEIKEFINNWISYKKELNEFNNLFLE